MKKILFFIPFGLKTSGGAERVLSIIANSLVKEKICKVDIISYEKTESFYNLSPEINLLSLNFKNSKNFFLRKIKPLYLLKNLRMVIVKNQYTHIVALGDDATILTSMIFIKKIKKISWIHNSIFQETYIVLKILRTIAYIFMEKIIILNTTDKKIYEKKYGKKVELIPNPIILKNSEENNIKENKTILCVGRLSKVKAFDQAIFAFSKIEKKYPDWKLKIIGKDEGEKIYLSNLIKKLNIKNCQIENEVQNIDEEYRKSDILLVTSLYECFSMVILEAKKFNLAIISFDCNSGPRDLVKNNFNGFLIKNRNIDDLTDKLEFLISNPEKLKEFKLNSKKDLENYNIEKIIDKWENNILI